MSVYNAIKLEMKKNLLTTFGKGFQLHLKINMDIISMRCWENVDS